MAAKASRAAFGEALLELGLPLLQHRRRGRNDDGLGLPAQQQLTGDETGFDRLAQARVVGDEEVHAREPERFAKRLHLVGVDLDARPKRRLEQVRIGGCDAAPPQRMEEGGEPARRVEALAREVLPAFVFEYPAVDLVVPEDVQRLALGVVIGTGQSDETRLAGHGGRNDVLDQPSPGADLDQLTDFRRSLRGRSDQLRTGFLHLGYRASPN